MLSLADEKLLLNLSTFPKNYPEVIEIQLKVEILKSISEIYTLKD